MSLTEISLTHSRAAVGLPGCTVIYSPTGQAGDYVALAASIYRGCGHGCEYCYVPGVVKMK
ncbi:MAG TPA: hypothetical protein VME23_15205 [Terracidiphilus sp.]|nr:hypothetical protein [Terracidiphilus sp.]